MEQTTSPPRTEIRGGNVSLAGAKAVTPRKEQRERVEEIWGGDRGGTGDGWQ